MKKVAVSRKLNSSIDLVLKQPYYIDRRKRSPILHSPRCLSNQKKDGIPKCCCLCNSLTDNNIQKNILSCQTTPSQPRYGVLKQWDLLKTKIFKQKIKQLLYEFHEMMKKQQNQLKESVRKQRQQQLERIANSICKLIKENKKIYNQVKRQKQISRILLANLKANLQRINVQKSKSKLLKILNSQESSSDHYDQINNIECFKKNQNMKDNQKRNAESNSNVQNKQLIHFGQLLLDEIQKNNQNEDQKRKQSIKEFLTSYKQKWNENKNNKQYIGSLFDQINRMGRKKKQQLESQVSSLQGSEKFYSVVKQLLTNAKHEKNKGQIKVMNIHSENSRVKKIKEKHAKFAQNFEQQATHNRKERQKKTYKFNIRDLSKSNRSYSSKSRKKTQNSIRMKKNQNEQKKNSKITKQSLVTPQKIIERRSEKKKTLKNRFQLGINYAKVISKLLKNSENDLSIDKFRHVKHKKMRTAQLRKKNKFIAEEDLITINKSNQFDIKQQVQNEGQNEDKSQSQYTYFQGEGYEQAESQKSIKLTKYEQARLIFNLRFTKIKSKNLLPSRKDLNASLNQQEAKKNNNNLFLQGTGQQNKTKLAINSFILSKNYEQFDFFNENNNTLRNSKWSSGSKRMSTMSNFNEQDLISSLALLTSYSSFDLKEVKKNITLYLQKLLNRNEKAKQFYNFLMFIEESRKAALEKQQNSSSLDQLKIQLQQQCIQKLVNSLNPQVEQFEGCINLFKDQNWNQKDLSLKNRIFFDKLDSKSIDVMYWDQSLISKCSSLVQESLKQIQII